MKIHFRPKTDKTEDDQIAHSRRRKRKRISVGFFVGLIWMTLTLSDFTTDLRHCPDVLLSQDYLISFSIFPFAVLLIFLMLSIRRTIIHCTIFYMVLNQPCRSLSRRSPSHATPFSRSTTDAGMQSSTGRPVTSSRVYTCAGEGAVAVNIVVANWLQPR